MFQRLITPRAAKQGAFVHALGFPDATTQRQPLSLTPVMASSHQAQLRRKSLQEPTPKELLSAHRMLLPAGLSLTNAVVRKAEEASATFSSSSSAGAVIATAAAKATAATTADAADTWGSRLAEETREQRAAITRSSALTTWTGCMRTWPTG